MLPSCSVSLGLHFSPRRMPKNGDRTWKEAREQSARDIFIPLRVGFDRKSGKVLIRQVPHVRAHFIPNGLISYARSVSS